MSTGYGGFEDLRGRPCYVDASQLGNRISICGKDDTDILLDLDETNARQLIDAFRMAFLHNGWEWPE